jgi:hypothetical protein
VQDRVLLACVGEGRGSLDTPQHTQDNRTAQDTVVPSTRFSVARLGYLNSAFLFVHLEALGSPEAVDSSCLMNKILRQPCQGAPQKLVTQTSVRNNEP